MKSFYLQTIPTILSSVQSSCELCLGTGYCTSHNSVFILYLILRCARGALPLPLFHVIFYLEKLIIFSLEKKSDFDVSETLIITDKQKSNLKREKCGGKC